MVYLDEEYKAHAQQDGGLTRMPFEDKDGFFAGRCPAFIEGYRVIPEGETWIREDGIPFKGLMIFPIVNPVELQADQALYDKQTIADLDIQVIDLTYQNILLELGV